MRVILTSLLLLSMTSRCWATSLLMAPGAVDAPSNYVAAADVNGDGFADVVAVGSELLVLLGNGDGTLRPALHFSASPGAQKPIIGEFTGDHHPDLAVLSTANDSVRLYAGQGDGTFVVLGDYPVEHDAIMTTSADLDGDGRQDLLVLSSNNGIVTVLMATGGGFVRGADIQVNPRAAKILAGDVNQDGLADVIAGSCTDEADVEIDSYLSDGHGSFQPGPVSTAYEGWQLLAMEWVRLNDDASPDLVVGCDVLEYWNTIQFHGRPDGTFVDARLTSGAAHRQAMTARSGRNGVELHFPKLAAIAVGDLDGDGIDEFLECSPGYGIFVNGRYGGGMDLARTTGATDAAVADLNGDGLKDVVVPGVGLMLSPDYDVRHVGVTHPSNFVVTDLNRDGIPDVVVAWGLDPIQAMLGDGTGSFVNAGNSYEDESYYGEYVPFAVGDVTGDGNPDLVGFSYDGLFVQPGDGAGNFGAKVPASLTGSSVAVADLMGSGIAEVLLGDDQGIRRLRFDATGALTSTSLLAATPAPNAIIAADLDGDGALDLVAENGTALTVLMQRNGGFAALPAWSPALPFALGRLDGDQNLDAISSDGTVWFGDGTGAFVAQAQTLAAGAPAIGDIDGDGRNDVCMLGKITRTYLGGGGGALRLEGLYWMDGASYPALADLNGDGRADLLASYIGGYSETMDWGFFGVVLAAGEQVTSTLLDTFEATPAAGGVELQWEFSATAHPMNVTLQRATEASGPWQEVPGTPTSHGGRAILMDRTLATTGTYFYRLTARLAGRDASFGPIAARWVEPDAHFALAPIEPNPCTGGSAAIRYSLPQAARVQVRVLDLQGRVVASLLDGTSAAGDHAVAWDARRQSPGVYFIRYDALGRAATRRVVLAR